MDLEGRLGGAHRLSRGSRRGRRRDVVASRAGRSGENGGQHEDQGAHSGSLARGACRFELLGGELGAAEDEQADPSVEEKLRGGDAKIASCLFVETLREGACRALKARLAERLADAPMQSGLYRLMCELTSP